jgi:hypothetical protein
MRELVTLVEARVPSPAERSTKPEAKAAEVMRGEFSYFNACATPKESGEKSDYCREMKFGEQPRMSYR